VPEHQGETLPFLIGAALILAMPRADAARWIALGTTIIVFAPEGFALCDNIRDGARVRMGEPLMRLP